MLQQQPQPQQQQQQQQRQQPQPEPQQQQQPQPQQRLPMTLAKANTRRIKGSEMISFVINITTKSSFSRKILEMRRRGNPQQLFSQQISERKTLLSGKRMCLRGE